ncbi:MAG: glycosyltransferase [Deltaproteobacteria bacterium]|nr:glycosyltransferase [Deltaproteobacteria bacterium]
MADRVAVLLPFRDVGPWLDEAITSVRREALIDRLVLVDDGSTDASSDIARAHAADDRRIDLVRTEGVGLVGALTLARSRTTATYLARMDGDDVSLADRIALSCAHLDVHREVAAVGTRIEAFPSEHVAEGMERYVAWQNGILTPHEHRASLFVEAPLCHPSVTLRASALDAVGGYRHGPFPEDYDLWLRLDGAGFELAKLEALGLRWRQREGRLTFRDPRYALDRHRALKAEHLAARLAITPRSREHGFVVWGAGPTGKRLARDLERHDARPLAFLDIDPDKVGRTRRGAPVHAPSFLDRPSRPFVIVAVGARGARDLITADLAARGLAPITDFLAAS